MNAFNDSFIHPFIHSSIHSSIHPLIHPFIHSCMHPFMHPFVCLFLISCFIHSQSCSLLVFQSLLVFIYHSIDLFSRYVVHYLIASRKTVRHLNSASSVTSCDNNAFLLYSGSCSTALGLGWDYKLPDSAFSASSELRPGRFLILLEIRYSQ